MEGTDPEEGTTGMESLRPSHVLDRIEVLALLPTYRLACVSAGLKSRGEIFLAMSVTDGGGMR